MILLRCSLFFHNDQTIEFGDRPMAKDQQVIGPYTLIKKIGRGQFGEVWLVEKRTRMGTTRLAAKLILDETPDLDAIKEEVELWTQASGHTNILPIIEA